MDAMDATGEAPDLGLGFPFWIACRRRFKFDSPFFAAGNMERELLAKHVALDLTEDERYQLQRMEIADCNLVCPIAGCGVQLECLEEFEDHYNTRHMGSCSICSRVYPTSRLLSIHISEVHDSFFQAKVARGFPMYECLVEGCGAKLKSYKSRQQHLMDRHRFPTTFEFYKKAHPSKHQRQKQQRKAGGGTKDCESFMDLDAKSESKQTRHKHYRPKKEVKMERKQESGMEVEVKLHHTEPTEMKMETELEKSKVKMEMEVEGEIDDIVSGVSKLSTVDTSSPSSVTFGHRPSRGFAFVPRSVRNQNQIFKKETTGNP